MSPRILIAGGGPAGAAAAIVLARHGLEVLLFDATVPPGNKLPETLYPEAECLLASLGVSAEVKVPLSATYIGRDRTTRLQVILDGGATAVDRNRLDARLRRAAADAGAEVLPLSVEKVESRATSVVASVRDRTFCADFLIDATGKNPVTGPDAPPPGAGRLLDRRISVFSHYETPAAFTFTDRTIVALECGHAYVLPIREGRVCVGFVSYDAGPKESPEAFYTRQLAGCELLTAGLRGATRCLPAIPAKNAVTDQPAVADGRVVRAGDALGFKDPFLWDGLSFALRTGVAAGQACAEAGAGGAAARRAYPDLVGALEGQIRRQVAARYEAVAGEFNSSMLLDPHVSPLLVSVLFSLGGGCWWGGFETLRAGWNAGRGAP
jgi:flavin-dependent dehydrogenase